jgi:hypothetical protein
MMLSQQSDELPSGRRGEAVADKSDIVAFVRLRAAECVFFGSEGVDFVPSRSDDALAKFRQFEIQGDRENLHEGNILSERRARRITNAASWPLPK